MPRQARCNIGWAMHHAGKFDHGFTPGDANTLQERLKPLVCKEPASGKLTALFGQNPR